MVNIESMWYKTVECDKENYLKSPLLLLNQPGWEQLRFLFWMNEYSEIW